MPQMLTTVMFFQHSKQLVKSLLTAGDGWKLRIVNCPKREFRVSPARSSSFPVGTGP